MPIRETDRALVAAFETILSCRQATETEDKIQARAMKRFN